MVIEWKIMVNNGMIWDLPSGYVKIAIGHSHLSY